MDCILVGIHGSPTALDALRWAADLADRAKTDLVAVRVFDATQAELPPDQWDLLFVSRLYTAGHRRFPVCSTAGPSPPASSSRAPPTASRRPRPPSCGAFRSTS